MSVNEEFEDLVDKLRLERDKLNLKMHLASLEARDEFAEAEKKWSQVKARAVEIAGDTKETSEEYIAKARIVGEELKEAYHRISKRL